MTVALKRSDEFNNGLIWFDAVLQFDRQHSASVTKHPLETGASVTDHTTIENRVFTIAGVISNVDFNVQRPSNTSGGGSRASRSLKQFENNTPVPENNVVISGDNNKFLKYLPESVSQFFDEKPQDATFGSVTRPIDAFFLEKELITIWESRELVTLVEFDGNAVKTTHVNCVMTNLTFAEGTDSGDALYPTMTFEQVKFVKSLSTVIPANVSATIKNRASGTAGKGQQSVDKGAASAAVPKTGEPTKVANASAGAQTETANSGVKTP
jgi:hypothetical protein